MKVVCISIDNQRTLKVGQFYNGTSFIDTSTDNDISIEGWEIHDLDGNFIGCYRDNHFMKIDEWRNEQIDKILK